jgi:phosphate transport system permease protein
MLKRTPFNATSIKKKGKGFLGIEGGIYIKAFFGGNAFVAFIVLALITIFLFREGAEFFPQYRRDMELYRKSGQEFVALLKEEVDQFDNLQRELDQVQVDIITRLYAEGKTWEEVTALTGPFQAFTIATRQTVDPLEKVVRKAIDLSVSAKETVMVNITRRTIAGVNLSELMTVEEEEAFLAQTRAELLGMMPEIKQAHHAFRENLEAALEQIPEVEDPLAAEALENYEQSAVAFLKSIPSVEKKLDRYDPDKPYRLMQTLGSFLFGTQWITNSSWQDFYGVWPLLSGSLLVTAVALFYAVPLGIFSAIYVNQVATQKEQNFIKPYIEFISAIPSVVIGFFGIAVFGTLIRYLSEQDWLAWVPFFPISERLNAYTAGGLLALMAVPTIFTLAEDALNNVPKAFTEASEALGATRWQTIWRIQIPTALSGIISAVLLGFGRVIGETMVVLLCAGNRIAVPNFDKGLGTFFEPVHTMTGIIAQEMGEVVPGSIHYRALFCVGIFLFFLSLLINYVAQVLVRRYKISAG